MGPLGTEADKKWILWLGRGYKHWYKTAARKKCFQGNKTKKNILQHISLVKKKVKLSLCLTKHHAMKTYWGSGGTAPLILDLGMRWM
jgi:hypothetical protein